MLHYLTHTLPAVVAFLAITGGAVGWLGRGTKMG